MLIGGPATRPNLDAVRRIKRALHKDLPLSEDAIITVTQLACLEDDCAPIETVIGLFQADEPRLQYKIHKSTDAIGAADLLEVYEAWGFSVQNSELDSLLKEN